MERPPESLPVAPVSVKRRLLDEQEELFEGAFDKPPDHDAANLLPNIEPLAFPRRQPRIPEVALKERLQLILRICRRRCFHEGSKQCRCELHTERLFFEAKFSLAFEEREHSRELRVVDAVPGQPGADVREELADA